MIKNIKQRFGLLLIMSGWIYLATAAQVRWYIALFVSFVGMSTAYASGRIDERKEIERWTTDHIRGQLHALVVVKHGLSIDEFTDRGQREMLDGELLDIYRALNV